MLDRTQSRREFLITAGALGAGLVAAACTSGSPPPEPSTSGAGPNGGKRIPDLVLGAEQLQLLSTDTPSPPGKIRFGFDLTTSQGGLVTEGSPQVYVAENETTPALGPFAATWYPFTAYERTGDRSPKTPLPGTYVVQLDVPAAGNWVVSVLVSDNGKTAAATGTLPVAANAIAAVGSKAISVPTPVATTENNLRQVCTREPPDHMHYISLDRALKNGKPTVVSFATPLLCESQLCGPVVDEQILVFQSVGPDRANFIHVEEFLPGSDFKPPPAEPQYLSPGFQAWHFTSEPWVLVIDSNRTIRARLEGSTTAPEIASALSAL